MVPVWMLIIANARHLSPLVRLNESRMSNWNKWPVNSFTCDFDT